MRPLRRPFPTDPTPGAASVSVRRHHRRRWPVRVALAGLALAAWLADPAIGRAASPSPSQLQALEAALNGQDAKALTALLAEGPGLDVALLQRRWSALRQAFPDARWQLSAGSPTASGRPTVNLRVSGTRREGSVTFRLNADQLLDLSSNGERISGQTLLREQTILRSGESNLPVSVLIPDAVLTGQRYDVDVIFDEPLDGALVIGGIQALTPQQLATLESPAIEVAPLGGGGLFRTVRAPFTPGSQTWAVLLVHPRGVVTTTKRVRVVSDRAQLTP